MKLYTAVIENVPIPDYMLVLCQVFLEPILKLKLWMNYKKIFMKFWKCYWRMEGLKWKPNLSARKQLW